MAYDIVPDSHGGFDLVENSGCLPLLGYGILIAFAVIALPFVIIGFIGVVVVGAPERERSAQNHQECIAEWENKTDHQKIEFVNKIYHLSRQVPDPIVEDSVVKMSYVDSCTGDKNRASNNNNDKTNNTGINSVGNTCTNIWNLKTPEQKQKEIDFYHYTTPGAPRELGANGQPIYGQDHYTYSWFISQSFCSK